METVKNAGWKGSKMRDGNGEKCGTVINPRSKPGMIRLKWRYISPHNKHGTYLFNHPLEPQHQLKCVVTRFLGGTYASFKKSVLTVRFLARRANSQVQAWQ
jgi:hypothetical protein